MNSGTRRVALYAIAGIAILASANALAHSYAGLFDWAAHHRLSGWQAMSWPAELGVFLAVGGRSVGLLVRKMTRRRASSRPQGSDANATLMLAARAPGMSASSARRVPAVMWSTAPDDPPGHGECDGAAANPGLLRDAIALCQHAAARGERLSQRALARQLRLRGHRFPN